MRDLLCPEVLCPQPQFPDTAGKRSPQTLVSPEGFLQAATKLEFHFGFLSSFHLLCAPLLQEK